MLPTLGYLLLATAFLVCLYGIGASIHGVLAREERWILSARNAMLLSWPLITLSALSLIWLLLTNHFEVQFVWSVTSRSMPTYLKVTSLWGGQAGSLVLWSWLMSAFASVAALRRWDRDREFLPWVVVVVLVTLAFFLSLALFFDNPFSRFWQASNGQTLAAMFPPAGAVPLIPSDGQGLNPLLRHPGMILHPPMLYLGFVSFVIPYSFGMAALITRRSDDRWIRLTRRWTLVGWLFLSLGLVLGARWSYDVLGWGGYWGWDPVEIAAFMPWLTGTAFLHSVMIQEKRGMLKRWNMVLIILTYALVIFATFLTRSGLLSSVHAFAQSSIGPVFFVFIGGTCIISLALLLSRWDDLGGEEHLTSLLSRETLFLVNNLLFLSIVVACFWGVVFPLISQLFTGQQVTVGPPFYQRTTGPLFAGLLLLMGIAPLSAWGHTALQNLGRLILRPFLLSLVLLAVLLAVARLSDPGALLGFWLAGLVALVTLDEFWRSASARSRTHPEALPVALWNLVARDRRRYGGYVIHLGVVLMAIGIVGSQFFQQQTQGTIAQGQEIQLGPYAVRHDSISEWTTNDQRDVTRAVIAVFHGGNQVAELHPRRDYYFVAQQTMTIPGVYSTVQGDLYLILVGWEPIASNGATFKIYWNPLVNFLWCGAVVFILGTLVAAWPDPERRRSRASAPHWSYVPAKQ
jgi:cytochrome c-type biogenesis protein CcmF